MIRLTIVEDSPTTREMLVYLFSNEPDIEVIATAKDGQEAVDVVKNLKPDIVLMDINMPHLNGLEASRIIMQSTPVPIVLMSSTYDVKELKEAAKSMKIGVLGIYEKPYAIDHPKFKELYEKLVLAIRLMSEVKVVRQFEFHSSNIPCSLDETKIAQKEFYCSSIAIGSSTGGPPVLHAVLKALPKKYRFPILVAQHISSEFIESFIEWLDGECELNVKCAQEGEIIMGGNVYIAPPKYHLTLKNNKIHLIKAQDNELNIPSIGKLFASLNDNFGCSTAAILLSGMGNDGSKEILKLRQNGCLTIGQNRETSTVFGMANEAMKLGGLEFLLSPEEILGLLLKMPYSVKEMK